MEMGGYREWRVVKREGKSLGMGMYRVSSNTTSPTLLQLIGCPYPLNQGFPRPI
jgi:hypothetical protein